MKARFSMNSQGCLMSTLPIQLITFDLYDTLIELHPHRWDRLQAALAKLGVAAETEALRSADVLAEDFYTEQNTIQPIRDRPRDEREQFRHDYMRRWLTAAGVAHDDAQLAEIRRAYSSEFEAPAVETTVGYGYRVFDDVIDTMRALRAAGVKTAVISNADSDVTELCLHFAFAQEMDLVVTSALVGWEKPDVRTFRAALDPLGIDPARALHIGDQPRSDVVGALETGMRAALIDRYGRHRQTDHQAPVMRDFSELLRHVEAVNATADPALAAPRG
jgi:HAD superfamily hydrolase (TIGR01549 family)